jgi:hypothetical protein
MACGCNPGPAPQTWEAVAPDGTVPADAQGLTRAEAYGMVAGMGSGAYVRPTGSAVPDQEPAAELVGA